MSQLIITNVFYCLILTTLSAALAVATWGISLLVLGRRKKYGLVFRWMWIVIFFCYVPVAYLMGAVPAFLGSLWGDFFVGTISGKQMWYLVSDSQLFCLRLFLEIWLAGIAVTAIILWFNKRGLSRMLMFKEKVRDQRVLECFHTIRQEIGIKRSIDLYETPLVNSPLTLTWGRQAVIIPQKTYTDEELQVIFSHELLHIKNKDYRKKQLTIIACCIHWFNPAVWCFSFIMNKWCETECDYHSVTFLEGRVILGRYFSTMLDLVNQKGSTWYASSVSDSEKEWKRRFYAVKGYLKVKEFSKCTIAVLTIGLVTLLTGTVYAAGVQVDQINSRYVLNHVEEIEEAVTYQDDCEETVEWLSEEEMENITEDDSLMATYSLSAVNWTLSANQAKHGSYVYLNKGDTVTMTYLVDPADAQIKTGLLCSDGMLTTIRTTDGGYHTFTIHFDGYYAVYAENMTSQSIQVGIMVR